MSESPLGATGWLAMRMSWRLAVEAQRVAVELRPLPGNSAGTEPVSAGYVAGTLPDYQLVDHGPVACVVAGMPARKVEAEGGSVGRRGHGVVGQLIQGGMANVAVVEVGQARSHEAVPEPCPRLEGVLYALGAAQVPSCADMASGISGQEAVEGSAVLALTGGPHGAQPGEGRHFLEGVSSALRATNAAKGERSLSHYRR
jgi:hypothetical protein